MKRAKRGRWLQRALAPQDSDAELDREMKAWKRLWRPRKRRHAPRKH